jgi:hypothetical protein
MALRQFQTRFALALLDRDRPIPGGLVDPDRFAVYRNNVHVSLIEALEARFPVTAALVGAEFFRGLARSFLELCPPRSPLLMTWGDELPEFIALFPTAAPVPYLADIARLEVARTQSYHAADAPVMSLDELARVPPDAWARARIRLHPSVRTLASQWPVVAIWQANQRDAIGSEVTWRPEDALVCRPGWSVNVHRLPADGAAFLRALASGCDLSRAADCFDARRRADSVRICLETVAAGLVTDVSY